MRESRLTPEEARGDVERFNKAAEAEGMPKMSEYDNLNDVKAAEILLKESGGYAPVEHKAEQREDLRVLTLDKLFESAFETSLNPSPEDVVDDQYKSWKDGLFEEVEGGKLHPIDALVDLELGEQKVGTKLNALIALKKILSIIAEADGYVEGLGIGGDVPSPKTPEEDSRRGYYFLRGRLVNAAMEYSKTAGVSVIPYDLAAGNTVLVPGAEVTLKDVEKLIPIGTRKVHFAEISGGVDRDFRDHNNWLVVGKGHVGMNAEKRYIPLVPYKIAVKMPDV